MEARDTSSRGQVTSSAAEVYEDFFVPALFGQFVDPVLDLAGFAPGRSLLDVGCGTGIVAREARRRAPSDDVVGVDPNPGMLAVARRHGADIEWRPGTAERLPFASGRFDHVVSQFAAMFFDDGPTAVREMARVTRPGGSVTIATWCRVEESPGYDAMVRLLDRTVGRWAADALTAPFRIGTADALAGYLEPVLGEVRIERRPGTARFTSIDDWVHTDVRGWTLADGIDDEQYAELRRAARTELAGFARDDGRVRFEAPALIGVADQRAMVMPPSTTSV